MLASAPQRQPLGLGSLWHLVLPQSQDFPQTFLNPVSLTGWAP